MKPQTYRVEPNSDYDLDYENNPNHQYVVDFLLDSLSIWYKVRDRPDTFEAEKFRCEKIINKISLLLKRITTTPTHKLKEKVTINLISIHRLMSNELLFFSERTKAHSLRLIRDHLQEYLE